MSVHVSVEFDSSLESLGAILALEIEHASMSSKMNDV